MLWIVLLALVLVLLWYIFYSKPANRTSENKQHFFEPEKGVHLYYRTFGTGPIKVFFIVGLGTNYMYWYPQVNFVQKKKHPIAEEYQICVMDNRGAGNSYV